MRILMLAQFYPPTVGGEEHHVQTLSAALAARGHRVAVATIGRADLPEFEWDQGVRVYRIRGTAQRASWLFQDNERPHAPPFPDPELMLALQRVVAYERPDIVHAHNWLVHSFLPLKAWSGAKLVVTLHDYSLICAKQNLLYDTLPCSGPALGKCLGCVSKHYGVAKGVLTAVTNWAMSAAERAAVDMFLPVSSAAAEGNRLLARRLPFQVMPNFLPDDVAVPREGYESYLAQLPAGDFLLFVGDLRRFKGIDILLQAYAGLSGAPPLVLIGRECVDTPTAFPPNVLVLKEWIREAVIEAWRRSMIGVLPSVGPETFGMVVIEAMATGRPVIASRIGGIPGIVVDGETGILIPPGDPHALRHALQQLLADPALRLRMGAAAQRRAMEFQASRVVPRIEAVYRQLSQASVVDPGTGQPKPAGEVVTPNLGPGEKAGEKKQRWG